METKLDLYPMYGLWHMPFWQTTWFFYTILTLVLLLLVGCVGYFLFLYRKKRAKKQPWELALLRLQELEQLIKNRTDEGLSSEFYVRITIIIKNYLYSRYHFDVESKTDEELIQFLETTSLDQEVVQQLRTICQDGVQAKFASASMIRSMLERDLAQCVMIIKKTTSQVQ
jgi:uncharacterized protein DUF4381